MMKSLKMYSHVYLLIGFIGFCCIKVEGNVCQGDPLKIVKMCTDSSVTSSTINIDTSLFSSSTFGGRCACELNVNSTALVINTLTVPKTLECGTTVTFKISHNPRVECRPVKDYIDTSVENTGLVEIATSGAALTDTGYCIQLNADQEQDLITMTCHENIPSYSTESPPVSLMEELLKDNNETDQSLYREISRNPNASVLFEPLLSSNELQNLLNDTEAPRKLETTTIPAEVVNAVLGELNDTNRENGSDISTVLFEPVAFTTELPKHNKNELSNLTPNAVPVISNDSMVDNSGTIANETSIPLTTQNNNVTNENTSNVVDNAKLASVNSPLDMFKTYLLHENDITSPSTTERMEQTTTQNASIAGIIETTTTLAVNDTLNNNITEFETASTPALQELTADSQLLSTMTSVIPNVMSTVETTTLFDDENSYLATSSMSTEFFPDSSSIASTSVITSPISDNYIELSSSSSFNTVTGMEISSSLEPSPDIFDSVVPLSLAIVPTKSSSVEITQMPDINTSTVVLTSQLQDTDTSTLLLGESSVVSTRQIQALDVTEMLSSVITPTTTSIYESVATVVDSTPSSTSTSQSTTLTTAKQDSTTGSVLSHGTETLKEQTSLREGLSEITTEIYTEATKGTSLHEGLPEITTEIYTETTKGTSLHEGLPEITPEIYTTSKSTTEATEQPPMKIIPIIPKQPQKVPPKILPNELDDIFDKVSDGSISDPPTTTKGLNVGESLGSTEEEDVLSEETVTIIVIGSVIGIVVLVAIIVILTTFLQSRRKRAGISAAKDVELNGKGIDNPLMELEKQEAESSFAGNGTIHEEPELEHVESSKDIKEETSNNNTTTDQEKTNETSNGVTKTDEETKS